MTFRRTFIYLAIAGAAAFAPSSFADTATATINVQANIVASCDIAAGDALNFADVDIRKYDGTLAHGTFGVTCTNGAAYTVALTGANDDGGTHYMQTTAEGEGAAAKLAYTLYEDDAGTVWNNAEPATHAGTGAADNIDVYAKIDDGQTNASVGNYSDTVTATVTYN